MSSPPPSSQAPRGLSPDDALPPVEPPSAGFILQLFIVPGVIVVIIVMVWLMFHWLVQQGNDPEAYVAALERNNEARWQAAVNLANALRNDRDKSNAALRHDSKLARRLADILEAEIKTGSMEQKPVTLRFYLCETLGELSVPDGLPTLVKAAGLQRSDEEIQVRLAALRAIALLSQTLTQEGHAAALNDAQVTATLLTASQDADPLVRSTAATALGVIGDAEATERLQTMLDDTYPDARYNAALGLARHGDARSVPVLAEMLDLDQSEGIDIEKQVELREFKRALLVVNALRAADQLMQKNPEADLSPVQAAVDKLLDAKLDIQVRAKAQETKKLLNQRRSVP